MDWALTRLLGLDAAVIRANWVDPCGSVTPVGGVVHAYAIIGQAGGGEQLVADINGVRPYAQMGADFSSLKGAMKVWRPQCADMHFDAEMLDDPDELFPEISFDPSVLAEALEDARNHLASYFAANGMPFRQAGDVDGVLRR